MAHMPDKPEPPTPTESVSLFGVADGWRRLSALAVYFGMCALTVRSCLGCAFWQLCMLHVWWFLGAQLVASGLNGIVCELVDAAKQSAFAKEQARHAAELLAAMQKQPIRALERSKETGKLEPVYAPLRERPLIDKEMGVRVRE